MARHPADLRIVESLQAAAIDDHCAVGLDSCIDVNAFFLVPAAKPPMEGSSVIGSMISSLTAKGRHLWVVADADLTKLANII